MQTRTLAITILTLAGLVIAGLLIEKARKTPEPPRPPETAKTSALASQSKPKPASTTETVNSVSLPDGFAGTKSCQECHRDRYQTYAQTSHSRSLQEFSVDQLPKTNNRLEHKKSKREYEVSVQVDQARHLEFLHLDPSDPDKRLPLANLPISHVMGSGSFAQAYLLKDGDFLMQSPVTWYVADNSYGMAPGYDAPVHRGCNRLIEDQCLYCHVGLVSLQKPQTPEILEHAIGCERCHGPSAAHANFHQTAFDDGASIPDDARSVDPSSLNRTALESICAQCHLDSDVVVYNGDRDLWDFRPGEDFALTRIAYKVDAEGDDPFAGHFDQMWQSKCYQKSETMTCVTCHDPHHDEPDKDLVRLRRNQCASCHEPESCTEPIDARLQKNDNSCVACHMPSMASRAVHSATTNHRIGIFRGTDEQPKGTSIAKLRRLQTPSELSQQQLKTMDALADAKYVLKHRNEPERLQGLDASTIEKRLLANGAENFVNGLSTLASIAEYQLTQTRDQPTIIETRKRAMDYANRVLAANKIPHDARVNALEVLANRQYDNGDFLEASKSYVTLTELRRSAIDFFNLGLCFGKLGQLGPAEQSLREAIRIDPSYPLPYRSMSVLYRNLDPAASAKMSETAKALMQIQ